MNKNREQCLELANRIYDLDAEVYRILGSSLGRVFNGSRERSVEELVKIMVTHDMQKVAADHIAGAMRTNLAEYLEKGLVK